MRKILLGLSAIALPFVPATAQNAVPVAPKPAAIEADGVPAVPLALVEATRPYMEFRTAAFLDWDPATRAMLVATRFGNVAQLHTMPGAATEIGRAHV